MHPGSLCLLNERGLFVWLGACLRHADFERATGSDGIRLQLGYGSVLVPRQTPAGPPEDWDPPRKLYRMPEDVPLGDMMNWLYGRPPWQDREACAIWMDDDYVYIKVDGRLCREGDLKIG